MSLLSQQGAEQRARLQAAFSDLLRANGLQPVLDRANKTIFQRNFRAFLSTARALLRVI
jgi:hypothetical protein